MKSGRQGEEAAEEPGSEREKTEAATGKAKGGSECVSLSSGAPVLRPAASVGPEPGPRRHRPAAANTGSSS